MSVLVALTNMPELSMFRELPTEGNRGPNLIIAQWLTLALSLIAVGLRLHGRCISQNIPGWDDYTILVATLFGVAQAAISIIQVNNRFGHHAQTLAPHQVSATIMWSTINAMLQIIGTLLVRLSACFLVLRMPPLGHTRQPYARAIYMLMGFFIVVSTASFFLLYFRCTPIHGLWDESIHARCVSTDTWCNIQKVGGTFEVVMNFLTASLPLIFFLKLQTRLREQWGVLTIAFLAYGTAGASICRVYCGIGSKDLSWDLACVEICLSIEQNFGTIITTLPTLGDLFLILLNHTRTSFLGSCFWPDPPLPSCWEHSQSDNFHLHRLPGFHEWHFDTEISAANQDAAFWQAVDSQMEGLNFNACALPQETDSISNPSSQLSNNKHSRPGYKANTCWESRSSSRGSDRSTLTTSERTISNSTIHKDTPSALSTPTSTPPTSTFPMTNTSKSTTPRSSKADAQTHSRTPSSSSPGSSDARSFQSRISRPSSWLRWSWRTGDDPGSET